MCPVSHKFTAKVNLYSRKSSDKPEALVSLSMYKGNSKYLVGKKLHKGELQFSGVKVLPVSHIVPLVMLSL